MATFGKLPFLESPPWNPGVYFCICVVVPRVRFNALHLLPLSTSRAMDSFPAVLLMFDRSPENSLGVFGCEGMGSHLRRVLRCFED